MSSEAGNIICTWIATGYKYKIKLLPPRIYDRDKKKEYLRESIIPVYTSSKKLRKLAKDFLAYKF